MPGAAAYLRTMSAPPSAEPSTARQLRRSTLALLAFWLAAGALLWAGFAWHEQRQRASLLPYTLAGGELVIPRSPDGHFYVDGEVNHTPVRFLVDTGASSVAISDETARAAGLPDGLPITVSTANGPRNARLLHRVPVKAGSLAHNDVSVTTGLRISPGNSRDALLGQSFLRHFEVRMESGRMLLRPRTAP